ncbi:hypothetical protein CEXT_114911 [Caerostris extrusa]|uniref:Uncharacterized protein n=1 Tax=Caerostris extrusa TaxID=172846 RepID=A0AAV4SPD1_CAEEX|nr:hypothetical protein CEXT_114911 [Caerostris extrusa]
MAEGDEVPFSFMDKVRFMMYGEQEKEAFLIEKKEKEEKKKGEYSVFPYALHSYTYVCSLPPFLDQTPSHGGVKENGSRNQAILNKKGEPFSLSKSCGCV